MPSRKSDPAQQPRRSDAGAPEDASTATAGELSAADRKEQQQHKDATTIEDLALPKSIVTRLAKGVLPPNTQIQANAVLALSKSATVFINYLASHANEHTISAGKKTIAPADVFKALDDTDFSFLRDPLEAEFARFTQIQAEKRTNYRQKARAKTDDADMADASLTDRTGSAEAAAPRAKKQRVDGAASDSAGDDDAETEDEADEADDQDDQDDQDEDEDEAEAGAHQGHDEEDEDGQQGSQDEAQDEDALEERHAGDDGDEALDDDDSD
ncbi:uncharacterized protein UV8b_02421 [Ustilaginoidea virens]|uniref:DNA polymerase epsilon subunit D n=1 Tax=Ustilaginoidea virens TaxID=1159556 RepID=A0A8E5HMW1_USTVR|nr:uncharacterized protein UV8b_02421 [Ustilaginoidea virens]QUC18180.1 hypothetical protein UV8b_02421 [Ustilaginoidea virens]